MKSLLLFLVLFLVVPPPDVSAEPYDLAACIERGLRSSPEILSRKIAIEESREEGIRARSLFLPSVTASYKKEGLVNNGPLERSRQFPNNTGEVRSVRLSQTLFSGFGGINSVAKSEYGREYRQTELQEARLALVRSIKREFFTYLKLLEDIETEKQNIAGLEKQLKVARAFFEQELAPQLAVLQAEVRLFTAQQGLSQVETQAEASRLRLNELLFLPGDGGAVKYSGSLADFDYGITKPLSEYISRVQARPAVRLAELNITMARKEADIRLSRFLPKVSVDAEYAARQADYLNNTRAWGYRDYEEDYWTLGLNVAMDLFQGGSDTAAYNQQMLAASRLEEDLRKLRKQLERELHVSYASLQEASLRIDTAVKTKDVALAALDRARTAFELGLGTTITVLDAQREAAVAMAGVAKARADFLLASADLEYLAALDGGPPAVEEPELGE